MIHEEIVLVDSTSTSLTVSWPEIPGAVRYILQYRKAVHTDDPQFETLSDRLTTTVARKRNLNEQTGIGYHFRVAGILSSTAVSTRGSNDDQSSIDLSGLSWKIHSEPFHLLTEEQERQRMDAPVVVLAGKNEALHVSWRKSIKKLVLPWSNGTEAYELQMRENGPGVGWTTIAQSLSANEAVKKNLTSPNGYQFRVRPVVSSSFSDSSSSSSLPSCSIPFSVPSEPVVALGLSSALTRVFHSLSTKTLLRRSESNATATPIPLAEALGGKEFVLLYASAHWCLPCRKFTPLLSQWYNETLGPQKMVEVVFVSADRDAKSFSDYYQKMPWLAVPYQDENARHQLMSFMRSNSIPMLVALDAKTGEILETDVVAKRPDVTRWRKLVAARKNGKPK